MDPPNPDCDKLAPLKKNPIERSAATAAAADDDDVSPNHLLHLFNFLGMILKTAKHHHQKQPRWDKKSPRDKNCQIPIKDENYHEDY